MNVWLLFSLILLGIWGVVFLVRTRVRKEMFRLSLFTMPFGLTEPFFVPEYWSPPSLFDLAARTGFDIESLIFSFAVGGLGAAMYETVVKVKHIKMTESEMQEERHKFHPYGLFSPLVVFIPLYLLTDLNPIYSVSIAMLVGGGFAIYCRPKLTKKILVGGVLFLWLYFVFFLFFNMLRPTAVGEIWNLEAISGIHIKGVPIEELMFAFTFGILWSSLYEHALWYKIKVQPELPT